MDAVDQYIPEPERASDKPFLMPVVDIERLALVQVVGQCDGDIVRSVDFQKPFHINKISRMSGSRKAPAEAGVRGRSDL